MFQMDQLSRESPNKGVASAHCSTNEKLKHGVRPPNLVRLNYEKNLNSIELSITVVVIKSQQSS